MMKRNSLFAIQMVRTIAQLNRKRTNGQVRQACTKQVTSITNTKKIYNKDSDKNRYIGTNIECLITPPSPIFLFSKQVFALVLNDSDISIRFRHFNLIPT